MGMDARSPLLDWRRTEVCGRTAAYGVGGDGPAIVFLHGWGLSGRTYRAALKLGDGKAAAVRPKVVGSGWTTVAVASVPSGSLSGSATVRQVLKVLPKVSGTWGSGRLLRGTLFSAVLTDDGRVAIGAVAPDRLYTALAGR